MLKQLYKSTRYSIEGICQAVKIERSFRWEIYLAIPLCITVGLLNLTPIERILLLLPIFLTLSCEMLNSSIEKTIDTLGEGRITPQFKYIKDCGSSAVFFMLLMTLISWVIILGTKCGDYTLGL